MFTKKIALLLFPILFLLSACTASEGASNKEYLGNADAKTELQIYSDLQCPACAKASNFTEVVLDKFGDDVKISFYHFPLESIHPNAFGAAVAAECAGEQGAFWKYVKYAYKFQDQLDTQNLKKHAVNLGLDSEKFNLCVDNQATAERVKVDLKRSISLGLKGTPSFAINGAVVDFGANSEEILKKLQEAVDSVESE